MDLIYGALLLHSAKKEINEANLKKVVEAVGEKPEAGKIKALVSSLEGVDIEEAIKQTAVATAAPAATAAESASEEKKEEKKEEDQGKKAEEAAAGLSSLFG